jgi:hypothetical protein
MTTTPVELPPLPEPAIVSYQTDSAMRTQILSTYTADQTRSYAASAVAAALQAQPAIPDEVKLALNDALLALSFCGKATQARALNAQAIRRIKSVLEKS